MWRIFQHNSVGAKGPFALCHHAPHFSTTIFSLSANSMPPFLTPPPPVVPFQPAAMPKLISLALDILLSLLVTLAWVAFRSFFLSACDRSKQLVLLSHEPIPLLLQEFDCNLADLFTPPPLHLLPLLSLLLLALCSVSRRLLTALALAASEPR